MVWGEGEGGKGALGGVLVYLKLFMWRGHFFFVLGIGLNRAFFACGGRVETADLCCCAKKNEKEMDRSGRCKHGCTSILYQNQ